MKKLALAAGAAALGFTAGCAQLNADMKQSLYGDYAISPLKVERNGTYAQLVSALTTAPAENVPPLVSASCFGSGVPADASCQASRNAAIAALMVTSEDLCVAHRKTIYGNDAAANIFFGTLTSLFAGAATVIHPATTKSILAALATLTNSERSLVNETVYKTMIVSAVDRKIVESRLTAATAIKARFTESVTSYPLAMAVTDVVEFHYSCSFMNGLERALTEGTQNTTPQKMLQLRETIRGINLQIAALGAAGVKGNATYDALVARLMAASDALSKLETQ